MDQPLTRKTWFETIMNRYKQQYGNDIYHELNVGKKVFTSPMFDEISDKIVSDINNYSQKKELVVLFEKLAKEIRNNKTGLEFANESEEKLNKALDKIGNSIKFLLDFKSDKFLNKISQDMFNKNYTELDETQQTQVNDVIEKLSAIYETDLQEIYKKIYPPGTGYNKQIEDKINNMAELFKKSLKYLDYNPVIEPGNIDTIKKSIKALQSAQKETTTIMFLFNTYNVRLKKQTTQTAGSITQYLKYTKANDENNLVVKQSAFIDTIKSNENLKKKYILDQSDSQFTGKVEFYARKCWEVERMVMYEITKTMYNSSVYIYTKKLNSYLMLFITKLFLSLEAQTCKIEELIRPMGIIEEYFNDMELTDDVENMITKIHNLYDPQDDVENITQTGGANERLRTKMVGDDLKANIPTKEHVMIQDKAIDIAVSAQSDIVTEYNAKLETEINNKKIKDIIRDTTKQLDENVEKLKTWSFDGYKDNTDAKINKREDFVFNYDKPENYDPGWEDVASLDRVNDYFFRCNIMQILFIIEYTKAMLTGASALIEFVKFYDLMYIIVVFLSLFHLVECMTNQKVQIPQDILDDLTSVFGASALMDKFMKYMSTFGSGVYADKFTVKKHLDEFMRRIELARKAGIKVNPVLETNEKGISDLENMINKYKIMNIIIKIVNSSKKEELAKKLIPIKTKLSDRSTQDFKVMHEGLKEFNEFIKGVIGNSAGDTFDFFDFQDPVHIIKFIEKFLSATGLDQPTIFVNNDMAGGANFATDAKISYFEPNEIRMWVYPFVKFDESPKTYKSSNYEISFASVDNMPNDDALFTPDNVSKIRYNINKYSDIFTELRNDERPTLESVLKYVDKIGIKPDIKTKLKKILELKDKFDKKHEYIIEYELLLNETLEIPDDEWANIRESVLKTVRSYIKFRLGDNTTQASKNAVQLSTDCVNLVNMANGTNTGTNTTFGPHQKIFTPKDTNENIFNEVCKGRLDKFFEGENTLLFAYGYSGSGKTYTFINNKENDDKSLLPRTIEYVIKKLKNKTKTKINVDIINLIPSREAATVEVYDRNADNKNPLLIDCPYKKFYDDEVDVNKINSEVNRQTQKTNEAKRAENRSVPAFISNELLKTINIASTDIAEDKIEETQNIINQIMKQKRDNQNVLPTPNNPESSRFFFFVTFTLIDTAGNVDKEMNKFTIVDMAGSEDVDVIKGTYVDNERKKLYLALQKGDQGIDIKNLKQEELKVPPPYDDKEYNHTDLIRKKIGSFNAGTVFKKYNKIPGNENIIAYYTLKDGGKPANIDDYKQKIVGYISPTVIEGGTLKKERLKIKNNNPDDSLQPTVTIECKEKSQKKSDELKTSPSCINHKYSSILFLMINDLLYSEGNIESGQLYALKTGDDSTTYAKNIVNTFNDFIIKTITDLKEKMCIKYQNFNIVDEDATKTQNEDDDETEEVADTKATKGKATVKTGKDKATGKATGITINKSTVITKRLVYNEIMCDSDSDSSLSLINGWRKTLNEAMTIYKNQGIHHKNIEVCLDKLLFYIYKYVKSLVNQGEGINKCISHKQYMFLNAAGNLTKYNTDRKEHLKYKPIEFKDFHMYPLLAFLSGAKHINHDGIVKYSVDNAKVASDTKFIVIVLVKVDNDVIQEKKIDDKIVERKINDKILASLKFAQNIGSRSAGIKDIGAKCGYPRNFSPIVGGGTKKKTKQSTTNHKKTRKTKP